MKIAKTKKLEEKKLTEEEAPAEDVVELDDATPKEIAADVEQGAAEAGKQVKDQAALQQHVKDVYEMADLIENPYGTAQVNDIKSALQMALEAALADRNAGETGVGEFVNIIIYGLAGFGKTSIVKEFCREHHLNIFECEAKTLDIATVGGIPYPSPDANGTLKQTPVVSDYWDTLSRPNTILFLDELNRARGNIIGSLLTLINEHTLPGVTRDANGRTLSNIRRFPNILFTVIAINPADDVFEDAQPLDPAMISRNAFVIEHSPNTADFKKHIDTVYKAIEKNKFLSPEAHKRYAGQHAIADKILTDKAFIQDGWDDAEDVRTIFRQRGAIGNYLNYRSFLLVLRASNGTKASYLTALKLSGFQPGKIQIIKNALANYVDVQTTGNNVFNKQGVNPNKAAKTDAQIASAIDDFIMNLPD